MAELRVPTLDFSALGQLPKTFKDARNNAAKQMTLDQLGRGEIDQATATQQLLAVDPQMGMSLAQLGNNQRDFQFRQQEATRAQGNADRSYGLQEKQIAATAGNTAATRALAERQFQWQQEQGNRPDIREVSDANGNKTTVMVDRKTNAVTPVQVPGGEAQPNNPFLAGGGTMNEGQSNAALYANRAMEAERVLNQGGVSTAGGSFSERGRANVPVVGNYLASENYQKFDQARRDFTAAILRKESGAAIGKDEYANADKQYFPQPGDSPSVIEQKRQNRISAIRGIGAAAGKGYKPSAMIDPQGNVVPRATESSPQSTGLPALPPGFQVVR